MAEEEESTPLLGASNNSDNTNNINVRDADNHDDDDHDDDDTSSSSSSLNRARRLLYVSHAFAQFSEQAWQFSIILFLAAFCDYESLVLVSSYGLCSSASVCLLGATAGRAVDKYDRLAVARWFLGLENISVLIATALCYVLLLRGGGGGGTTATAAATGAAVGGLQQRRTAGGVPVDASSILFLVGIHVFGSLAQILDRGFLVAMERDWVVVMSQVANDIHLGRQEEMRRRQQQQRRSETSNGKSNNTINIAGQQQKQRRPPEPNKQWLSATNVAMRQIDLTCKVAAPAVAGFVIAAFDQSSGGSSSGNDDQLLQQEQQQQHHQQHGRDLTGAALLVGVVNVAALVVEYICTAEIYRLVPALGEESSSSKQQRQGHNKGREESLRRRASSLDEGSSADLFEPVFDDDQKTTTTAAAVASGGATLASEKPRRCESCLELPRGLRVYLEQPIAPAGLGLAMLYLNSLTFGALMTAYLVWRGMRLETVGIWRGVSAAVGLAGTLVYTFSAQRMTLVSTGTWSILYQFACVSLGFVSLFVENYFASMVMLVFGVCASRIGLWVFDMTVTQLMQEFIPDGIRGVVGGTQQSLNSFFFLGSFALGLVFPDPNQFYVYVAAGYAFVGVAAVVYAIGIHLRKVEFMTTEERKSTFRPHIIVLPWSG